MSNINLIADYVRTKQLELDLVEMKDSINKIRDLIKKNFHKDSLDPNTQLYQKVYSEYNLLMYPLPQFHELYEEIKKMFWECNTDSYKQYYVQCWLNVYNKNDFIEWHGHSPEEHHAWHGFFCVDCEPSYTRYAIKGQPEDVLVHSKDNLMVLSPSGRDRHRTAPWPYDDRPRLTIAFDIIPKEFIIHDQFLNHWIPI
jgi:hypothetical protein